MNRSTHRFREGLISITAIIGIGLATLSTQTLSIDQIEVALADIDASNGIIHAIDNVLVPSPSD